MKIKVLFTGGTIGSSERQGTIDMDAQTGSLLLARYREFSQSSIEFEIAEPTQMLSENVQVRDLVAIGDAVKEAQEDSETKGVIVTHGTDTLSFTARYLAVLFAQVRVPVVLVASLFPLVDARANGHANFSAAVDYIMSDQKGAVVAWGNVGELAHIYPMACLESVGDLDAQFSSAPFKTESVLPAPTLFSGRLDAAVLRIQCRALTDFTCYHIANVHAVVVEPYHSGTVCTTGSKTSFLRFLGRCERAGIPVIVVLGAKRNAYYAGALEALVHTIPVYGMDAEMVAVIAMLALADGIPLAKETFER